MPSDILAILPPDFDLGFNLTGIDTHTCSSIEEARIDLVEETANRKYSILFIDEKFLLSFDKRLRKKIEETTSPLVMGIPLKRSLTEEVKITDYFTKIVQSAIGYEIRMR